MARLHAKYRCDGQGRKVLQVYQVEFYDPYRRPKQKRISLGTRDKSAALQGLAEITRTVDYDDRLEISSIGRLPFGQTPADLTRPHSSQPWNPLIASVFYRRGLIETWGRGTLKMAELTEEAGLAPPEFEEQAGAVIVRFRPTRYVPPSRVSHDLTSLQRELLEILAAHGAAAISEMMDRLQTPAARRTVQENLALLQQLGLVEVSGRGRGARWRLLGGGT